MKNFRRKPGQRGFTMMELMMVVVIVGILAAIAIPLYSSYVKNARVTEATGRIGEIITASKAWAQEHQSSTGNPVWPPTMVSGAQNGIVSLTPTDNFDYQITSGGGDATATALVIQADGTNKMTGVQVIATVTNIGSTSGVPVVTGL